MTTYFISRHAGARDWAAQEGIAVDRIAEHLVTDDIAAGDVVIGSLPVNLAAEICQRGARYFHLTIDLSLARRGIELDADAMRACGARIEEFRVSRARS